MDKTSPPNDTRATLLETGLKLFAEQGYNGTGIKEIVDAAGVPKGSFYNYFKSKEDFGGEVISHYANGFATNWSKYFAEGPEEPLAALRYTYERLIRYHEQCEVKAGCLLGNFAAEMAESSEVCRIMLQQVVSGWRASFVSYLRQAQADGSVRTDLSAEQLADFFWNGWEGALLRMKIERSTAPVRACVTLMFDHFFLPQ
ncbi:TetR family transcriptional regulator C-terminal domain-containing protein [Collimonas sp.]|jgi:TetR/AcrR family transcriptional repressor of nem operon|uniref:TetR/AcrR family transcriptional regulator n=1 Tax=Collimonas sp. TaxID=1963772 RepID=UPI0037C0AA62